MEPTTPREAPVVNLSDKTLVKEQIKSLKVGERLRVVGGDYVLIVGVPSNDDETSVGRIEAASDNDAWFD